VKVVDLQVSPSDPVDDPEDVLEEGMGAAQKTPKCRQPSMTPAT
jgi:hypothetical protein